MMHDDELAIDEDSARALIAAQFPHWAKQPVSGIDGLGTVNSIYRIGSTMAARFPLRAADPVEKLGQLRREANAMSEFAAASPYPSPTPVAIGAPGDGYSLPWSIQTWIPGNAVTSPNVADSHEFAHDLAVLISSLRSADTCGRTFAGGGRGGDLCDHDEWMDLCFRESDSLMDVSQLRSLWSRFRELQDARTDVMSHGDLIPANLVISEGRLVGVLDTGGFGPADPSLDLVAGWHLFERETRETLRAELNCDSTEWSRGAAWALQQAMGLVWYYRESVPELSALGMRTIERVLEDPEV